MSDLFKQNHFEKFALNPGFELDLDELETKYLQFQQTFHPDKLTSFSVAKNAEKKVDLEYNSVLVNEAFEILKNPLKRAIYLLKLHGIDIDDNHSSVKPDHETLVKNLELRELIFESKDQEELQQLKKSCQKEQKEILKLAQEFFEQKNYSKAALELIKAKYLDKSLIEIKHKLKN